MIENVEKTNPKGRPKCFSREEALSQAMGVFCKKGYEATSVAELGKAMGMNPPSLYNAFGDKESLFVDVLKHYHLPYAQHMKNIFLNADNTPNAIWQLMELSITSHAKKDAIGCLLVNSSINVTFQNDKIAQAIRALHELNEETITERLKQGQKNGDISRSSNASVLAHYIYGIILGAAVLGRGRQSPAAVKNLVEQGYKGFLKLSTGD